MSKELVIQGEHRIGEPVGFLVLLALLLLVTLLPVWHFQYPGMADYPNHLARIAMLSGAAHPGWEQYYFVSHKLVPNLAMEYFVQTVETLGVGGPVALRMFAGAALVAPVIGTVLLTLSLRRGVPWIALLSIPLAFHRYYVWGFLNYAFSLGIGLSLLALCIRTRDSFLKDQKQRTMPDTAWIWGGGAVLTCGIVILLFSHLAGLGIFLVAAYSIVLFDLVRGQRSAVIHFLWLAAATLPATLVYVVFFYHSEGGLKINYHDFLQGKVAGVLSAVYSYSWLPALATIAVLIIAFMVARYHYRASIQVAPQMLAPMTGVLAAFLVLPASMMGSGMLDRRLFVFLCFLAVASVSVTYSRQIRNMIVITICVLVGIKTTEIWSAWRSTNESMVSVRKALAEVRSGSKIIQYVVLPSGRNEFPPLRHTVSFAVIDRGTFIPSLFAQPFNGESVAYRTSSSPIFKAGKGGVITSMLGINQDVCDLYDYVLITGLTTTNMPTLNCLKPKTARNDFTLFFVKREDLNR